jgi:D-3-phosphoglycerate dehydrogenase / 2-oxoglutarate reductase
MPKVLIAPAPLRNEPGTFRDMLVAAGFTPLDPPGKHPTLTEGELRRYLPEIDAMIAGGELLDDSLLSLAPRLRVIARTGVGYDAIDVGAASARKIPVAIAPGTNQDSVAEHGFGLMLGLARRIAINDRIIRAGGWDRTTVQPVRGKTLGLVGLGRIGRAMAIRAKAFSMSVVAFDPAPATTFDQLHAIQRLSFDELLATSDVVSLHFPLTTTTRGMFNAALFARMKRGALLINTARGGLVVESDLHAALVSGQLAGAGLDVLDPEPPVNGNPLLALPNVILSPHMAGVDERSMADMATKAAHCVLELYAGRWPSECIVNGEIADGWKW